jgi:PEP-CTERM motif
MTHANKFIAICTALLSTVALGQTISFNEFASNNTTFVMTPSFSSDEFKFNASLGPTNHDPSGSFLVWGRNYFENADPGGATITLGWPDISVSMSRVSGGEFNLYSIDLADTWNRGETSSIKFTFEYYGGGSVDQFVNLDNISGLQTIILAQTSLSKVTWMNIGSDANGDVQFDNINVGISTVPEPETYMMLFFGLVLVLVRKRLSR